MGLNWVLIFNNTSNIVFGHEFARRPKKACTKQLLPPAFISVTKILVAYHKSSLHITGK